MPTQTGIQFGVYEFDPETGELHKDGRRLHIQEQPLKVLRELVENPGQLVTRDQLKQAIAPESTFGDFDHALNVAVAKLRTALNDPAEHPVYIETLHKRGYRFIAPLTAQVHPPVGAFKFAATTAATAAQSPRRNLAPWFATGATVLLIAVGIALWFWPQSPRVYQSTPFTTLEGFVGLPAISPDGSEIAFAWSPPGSVPNRIYIQSVGSAVARPLIDDPAPLHTEGVPTWFRDGSALAYLRRSPPDIRRELWTVPRSGGVPRELLEAENLLGFDIAPDGKSVVTSEEHPKGVAALYLVSLADMSRRQLTHPGNQPWGLAAGASCGDVDPRFSPDGRSIVFVRREGSGADLYLISVKGGDPEWLSQGLTRSSELVPRFAWAPDGKSLIVGAVRPTTMGTRSWWRLRLTGKRWEALSIVGSNNPDFFSLSADGRRLVFQQRSRLANILRMGLPRSGHPPAETINVTQSTSQNAAPQLSPDGKRLVFASNRSGHWEIYIADSDGSRALQLTHMEGGETGSAVWSPDGKQIAFDSRPGQHSEIFVIQPDGGQSRQITFSNTDAVVPIYSRDGLAIYFSRLRQGGSDAWKLPYGGGNPVLAVPGALHLGESIDGGTFYYTKASDKEMTIYSRLVVGGNETVLLREIGDIAGTDNAFVTVKDGIYYRRKLPFHPGHDLMFYNFARHATQVVLQLPFEFSSNRISISPDGAYLFVRKPEFQSNLMLVENFR